MRVRQGMAAVAVLLTAALLGAPVADASCGGTETARPQKKVNPHGHPPLAIGDSSMLLAIHNLAHVGYKVNARGCRQMSEGLAVMRKAKHQHRLPHLVVIALGADWVINRSDIRKALHLMGRKRVLGLVTPRELGGGSGHDAKVIRRIAGKRRERIKLLDWVAYSEGHPDWFQPDGLHLTFPGAHAFTRLLRGALPLARAGKFPQ